MLACDRGTVLVMRSVAIVSPRRARAARLGQGQQDGSHAMGPDTSTSAQAAVQVGQPK